MANKKFNELSENNIAFNSIFNEVQNTGLCILELKTASPALYNRLIETVYQQLEHALKTTYARKLMAMTNLESTEYASELMLCFLESAALDLVAAQPEKARPAYFQTAVYNTLVSINRKFGALCGTHKVSDGEDSEYVTREVHFSGSVNEDGDVMTADNFACTANVEAQSETMVLLQQAFAGKLSDLETFSVILSLLEPGEFDPTHNPNSMKILIHTTVAAVSSPDVLGFCPFTQDHEDAVAAQLSKTRKEDINRQLTLARHRGRKKLKELFDEN